MEKRLSFSQKLVRLRHRMRDPEWRKYGRVLLFGKLTGIGLIFLLAVFMHPEMIGFGAHAQASPPPPDLKGNDIVNPINTVWTLLAAFLVFGMQVGFTMLEAGFCRSRETVNVLMECVVDTCLCGLLFYAWGFAYMFSHGNGWIGQHWFFLQNAPATYETTGVAFLAFWLFQFAFADTCSTITSGAMIGRTAWMTDVGRRMLDYSTRLLALADEAKAAVHSQTTPSGPERARGSPGVSPAGCSSAVPNSPSARPVDLDLAFRLPISNRRRPGRGIGFGVCCGRTPTFRAVDGKASGDGRNRDGGIPGLSFRESKRR